MPKRISLAGNPRISRALQLAFLVLVILPVILMTTVAYVNSRQALQDEIRHRLRQDASMLAQGVDAFMFERLENLHGWQRLGVMQDAQVGDVDKRLADFLRQLKSSYGGIYTELMFVDPAGKVVASSDIAHIGSEISASEAPLEKVLLDGTWVEVLPLRYGGVEGTAVLPLRTTIQSGFETTVLGSLYALLNWREIESILDRVTAEGEADAFRFSLLLDRDSRRIGHSNGSGEARYDKEMLVLNRVSAHVGITPLSADERRKALIIGAMGTFEIPSSVTSDDGLLVGYAGSPGFQHFKGFGWRVVVAESMDTAFAPVRHLLWMLLLVLLVTVLVAVFLASRMGSWIAAPIVRLADYSNHIDDDVSVRPPPLQGVAEVQELNAAMTSMAKRLQRSRQQLIHASKLAAVGELAATLAHEVRTPLGILRSSSQLLASEQGLSREGQEMVAFILSESERLNRLVTLLLESGRPRAPVFVDMDLKRTVLDCVALLRSKADCRHVVIDCELGACPAMLSGDAGQLQQAFLNLLLNAIQIVPEGGRIRIDCEQHDAELHVGIEDSGPGIAEEIREKVFEPFFSQRDGGFGLGLSIVQQIISQHGGSIAAAQGHDLGGARFTVVLPLARMRKKNR
jgi:signal transduction histidine kinase